jgi:ParB/RepB/Spo0J family partition protein
MNAFLVSTDHITVPEFVERPLNKVADSRDADSIKKSGIQQALIVVPDGNRLLLAKGLRRLRIARSLGLGKVPVIKALAPKGYDPEVYVRELRLALDMHRQDLLPSQKCSLVETLKERFNMTNKQVAAYLGIDADSVTNWLAVKGYIDPVKQALDAGRLTMQAARVFDGMTDEGQNAVLKKHEKELFTSAGGRTHKELRRMYPPEQFPTYYRKPELVAQRLSAKGGKRKSKARPTITSQEKRRLSNSLEMREIELREGVLEEKRLKAEIMASIAPLSAILRNEKLRSMIPEEMGPELERFAEIYV